MTHRDRTQSHQRGAKTGGRRVGRCRLRRSLAPVLRHVLLVAVTIACMVPFYWMAISALKDNSQIFARPMQWWPNPVRWDNILGALTYPGFPFLRFLWNSVFYAGCVSLGTVLSCAAVGYGFARLHFPGRETFLLFKHLSLLGTYAPLICPAFLGNAFFIFLLRQFFLGLPQDLSDAARVDGAGEFRIFWQIMLPLVRPALMVAALLSFIWTWHEFFGPLIYLSDRSQYPLSLGLFAFRAQHTTEWSLLMAASTLATLPLVVLFFCTQRSFLEGMTLTGIRGS